MQITEKASLDSRGRLLLPMKIRKYFKLHYQKEVLVIGDTDKEVIKIFPFTSEPSKYIIINILISDKPGTFKDIINILYENNIDFKETSSETLINGAKAEMKVVADTKKCPLNNEELKKLLENKKDLVELVEIKTILD